MNASEKKYIVPRQLHPANGILMACMFALGILAAAAVLVGGLVVMVNGALIGGLVMVVLAALAALACFVCLGGIRVVHPNEALVLTLFGHYYGTVLQDGCFWVNPFSTAPPQAKRVSLKLNTLENKKQKVNDSEGNPILIGTNVVWRVAEPTQAVFNVERYQEFISIQTDSTIRNIARMYPYDLFYEDRDGDGINDNAGEKTLRSSALEIAEHMRTDLQAKVGEAGIIIEEVKITDLAYAEEIAAAMLQRQQATAVIAARAKIVDGAVGMVKLALDRLSEDDIVVLDDERKAAMVSNLLVVLCSGRDTQPVVNSGSIY